MIFGGEMYLSYTEEKEQNSVRGSFASPSEIDGAEESMGATLTWS